MLIIRGGQGSGVSTTRNGTRILQHEGNDGVWDGSFPMKTNDPTAGMDGFRYATGSDSRAERQLRIACESTNGRVWATGESFAMYNPDAVGNTGQDGKFYLFIDYERSHSASALDMDQERHNLPWNGSYYHLLRRDQMG
ncbi:MAG: hypothetical protein V9G11_07245 [Bifidobacterium adolescentis]